MTSQKKEKEKVVEKTIDEKVDEATEKMAKVAEDLTTLLREGKTFTTIKGEEIKVPALTGTAEKRSIKTVVSYLRDHSGIIKKVFGEDDKEMGVEDILSFVIDVADDGYEAVQELASHLLGKDVKWVDEHLLIPDLIGVIAPFMKAEGAPIFQSVRKGMTMDRLGQRLEKLKTAAKKSRPSTGLSKSSPEGETPTK